MVVNKPKQLKNNIKRLVGFVLNTYRLVIMPEKKTTSLGTSLVNNVITALLATNSLLRLHFNNSSTIYWVKSQVSSYLHNDIQQ